MALFNWQELFVLAVGSYLCYGILLVIYRLFFHPLSRFPGPKLAASTLWYEFYYDAWQEGQWMFKIKEMHEKYGPIIRINPHELHIKDPEFYQEIYAPLAGARRRNKYQWFVNMAGAPGSLFATVDQDLHRLRRSPLNSFFSKKAVVELEPLIKEKTQKLSSRLTAAAQQGAVVPADCAFMAVTMDVICDYCFGSNRQYLDSEDFGKAWKDTIAGAWQKGGLIRAFPVMPYFMARFPRGLANRLDPEMGMFLAWKDSVRDAVRPIVEYQDGSNSDKKAKRTIFHTLRDSDLPPQERTLTRLSQEGEVFTAAGSETTARTLTIMLYYLVTHPECMRKLKEELKSAMPDATKLISWTQLEQLPYLSAVIQEGLRISGGITTRLPRVASEALQYQNWTIPAGTPISQTPYFVLMDPVVFPEPTAFNPERWLQDGRRLDKYQVSFNKGSRACIGINLAYAELYLTCATIYRRFSFELYDTTFKDIEMVHDFFVGAPAKPFRGVKVKVVADVD